MPIFECDLNHWYLSWSNWIVINYLSSKNLNLRIECAQYRSHHECSHLDHNKIKTIRLWAALANVQDNKCGLMHLWQAAMTSTFAMPLSQIPTEDKNRTSYRGKHSQELIGSSFKKEPRLFIACCDDWPMLCLVLGWPFLRSWHTFDNALVSINSSKR